MTVYNLSIIVLSWKWILIGMNANVDRAIIVENKTMTFLTVDISIDLNVADVMNMVIKRDYVFLTPSNHPI